jgi:hypothetical protein
LVVDSLVAIGALLVVVVVLIWRSRLHLRLFVIEVHEGAVARLRGRIPRPLLSDIADVVARARARRLRIICRIEDGHVRVEVIGDHHPEFVQTLRNLVGGYPLARLKQAPRAKD